MSWQAWFTLAVIVVMVALMARDRIPPVLAVLGGAIVLLLAGVIEAQQAFAGFANPAPITVAALYVLARAVETTGALEPIVARMMTRNGNGQRAGGVRGQLLRITLPTGAASAFLNNTPIVAALAPQIQEWAKRRGVSASPFLMPLSFAAILGGMITVIGTSTNLVVSGLMQDAGLAPIAMFELSRVGLPVAAAGIGLVVLLAPRLLPDRHAAADSFRESIREFTVAMRVLPGGPVDGASLEEAGLRNLEGVYCVQVNRGGHVIAPVAPTEVLHGDDVLTFVGKVDQIVDLQRKRGLVSTEEHHVVETDDRHQAFFEVVVGPDSPLVGKTLKEMQFRDRYQAAVVGLHRAGRRVDAKLGEVELVPGDTMLLLAHRSFRTRWRDAADFLLVAPLAADAPTRTRKAPIVAALTALLVLVAGAGLLPILEAALVVAFLLVALRVLTLAEARDAVDLNVIVLIAAAFGIANAMTVTGLADEIAGLFVTGFAVWGALGALLAVLLATSLMTEAVTNNAAAALMFPIAVSTANAIGADPRGFAIAVAIMASASFLTPVGYQTNTIVYGLGGYRFTDYVRLGLPLNLVVLATCLVVIPLAWPL